MAHLLLLLESSPEALVTLEHRTVTNRSRSAGSDANSPGAMRCGKEVKRNKQHEFLGPEERQTVRAPDGCHRWDPAEEV